MSRIFHCAKLHLTKCNGSWILSIKYSVNFNFQPPAIFVFFIFLLFAAKVVLLKVVYPLKICQHTKYHGPTLTGQIFHPPQQFENPTIAIFKRSVKKIIIQTNLVGMSMISHCTRLRLYKCNGSWVVSLKQNVRFNLELTAMFLFLVFGKGGLIKSFSSSDDLSDVKILWPYVDWSKFWIHLSSLKIPRSPYWKGLLEKIIIFK
jgi:hypothetical protein